MEYYVHNISPFAIQFTETFGIRWYGLSYLAGFLIAYLFVDFLAKKEAILLTRDKAADLITYAAIGTLAGGRLGYCLFYAPELLTSFSGSFPYWGVLEVHKGGMASHGGILGVMLACYLFAVKNRVPTTHLIDLCTVGGSIGIFFGRLANFINGELYGRQAPEGTSWAVKFPQEIYSWGAQQTEKLKQLAPAVEELGSITHPATGQRLASDTQTWLSWVQKMDYSSHVNIDLYKEALVKATQSGQAKVIEALEPALTLRYPSQVVQAVLEGLLVFLILIFLWRTPKKIGIISSAFGICYSIARIIGEQFRLPDAHIGFEALGLTRGQWLSVGLLMISIFYLIWILKQNSPSVGGWLRKNP